MAEYAAGLLTTGERADEIDGVDLDVLATVALAEGPAGRAVEHELERLAVERGPFGDDVGDQPAVVVGLRCIGLPVAWQMSMRWPRRRG